MGRGQVRRSKYDAHNTVLSKTYGAFADSAAGAVRIRRRRVNEREELLNTFAICVDSQRAWLLLEDYFERLSLSRKDFPTTDWWPKLLSAQSKARLEELAFSFPARPTVAPYGTVQLCEPGPVCPGGAGRPGTAVGEAIGRLAFSAAPTHLDSPRASLRVVCEPRPDPLQPARHQMAVSFHLVRPAHGEKR